MLTAFLKFTSLHLCKLLKMAFDIFLCGMVCLLQNIYNQTAYTWQEISYYAKFNIEIIVFLHIMNIASTRK